MNVAIQLYHTCEYKVIAKMCEECSAHTELNANQSNLKIDFLLSRNFLPVSVAYKTTDNHGFRAFSGQGFQFLLKHKA